MESTLAQKQKWDAELYEARHGFVWQLGEGLIDLLNPRPGEQILDLGCGPGQLTHKIAARGTKITGIDSSAEMIGQARQNYPGLRFVLEDAAAMTFEGEFDAIFSNASLHWMLEAKAVAHAMFRALRPGGRLVAEMGGRGNVQKIKDAVETVLVHHAAAIPPSRVFFPSVAEYSGLLEAEGFDVRLAHLFDRPTPLEGDDGMKNWLGQFEAYRFESLPAPVRAQAMTEAIEMLRPSLYHEGQWSADYRRLRITALKPPDVASR